MQPFDDQPNVSPDHAEPMFYRVRDRKPCIPLQEASATLRAHTLDYPWSWELGTGSGTSAQDALLLASSGHAHVGIHAEVSFQGAVASEYASN